MNTQQQMIELVKFCIEFASVHSINGYKIEVDYTGNTELCFLCKGPDGLYHPIFGHPTEKSSVWFVDFYRVGVKESIESAMIDIKQFIYKECKDGQLEATMHPMQKDVSVPCFDEDERRKFLQQGLPS